MKSVFDSPNKDTLLKIHKPKYSDEKRAERSPLEITFMLRTTENKRKRENPNEKQLWCTKRKKKRTKSRKKNTDERQFEMMLSWKPPVDSSRQE